MNVFDCRGFVAAFMVLLALIQYGLAQDSGQNTTTSDLSEPNNPDDPNSAVPPSPPQEPNPDVSEPTDPDDPNSTVPPSPPQEPNPDVSEPTDPDDPNSTVPPSPPQEPNPDVSEPTDPDDPNSAVPPSPPKDPNPDVTEPEDPNDPDLTVPPPTNYCSICPRQRQHIACNNDGAYSPACTGSARVLSLTPAFASVLVARHNVLRNQVARGGVRRYRPATRMATIRWDNELAQLAALNVKQCVLKHDQCRSTVKFPYAGQNLAMTWWTGPPKSLTLVALQQIQSWFVESEWASMTQIRSFRPVSSGKQIGHFTQMVQEKAVAVGCAILREVKDNAMYQFMACNYAYTNVLDQPVYAPGLYGGSECETGHHQRYKYLCSPNESYNVTSLQ